MTDRNNVAADIRRYLLEALEVVTHRSDPTDVVKMANALLTLDNPTVTIKEQDLDNLLRDIGPSDPLAIHFGRLLNRWDSDIREDDWVDDTDPQSPERREVVVRALGIKTGSVAARRLVALNPVISESAVISQDFTRWLTPERMHESSTYWDSYKKYLQVVKDWDSIRVERMSEATLRVVERLADPMAEEVFPARGLVVGHVQSGKTANYSGVIARAIDAGYRFVIVLTGISESLRRQTQRRLDMEVLGKVNILAGSTEYDGIGISEISEYFDDPGWQTGEFSTFIPDEPGLRVQRVTSHENDFKKAKWQSLNFTNEVVSENETRLAVVKKNKDNLNNLIAACRVNQDGLKDIPVLIIDDESDQASPNTAKQFKNYKPTGKHSKINEQVMDLLKVLPRAQYVGYTATPFATVFIDPDNLEDLFPRDFIIALNEPEGYMGPSTFFDLFEDKDQQYLLSNKQTFIRSLSAEDDDSDAQDEEISRALATFIVTGAIKQYRMKKQPDLAENFRHHTMLVHEATEKKKHSELAQRILRVWKESNWSKNTGRKLLELAFSDIRPTLESRKEEGIPFVDSFNLIEEFILPVIEKVELSQSGGHGSRSSDNCVIILNTDNDVKEALNFSRDEVWKILVGGAMLSRGFTVEGLTISYFRRSPAASDTLLQMGRWFGYRPGYRDLVRVYLANAVKRGKKIVDLYDAFESTAKMEEAFRSQLAQYAGWRGDKPAIRPQDVLPLVHQYLPELIPTAKSKMQNTRITQQRELVFSPKAMADAKKLVRENWTATLPIVEAAKEHISIAGEGRRDFSVYGGIVAVDDLIKSLRGMRWLEDHYFEIILEPKISYYKTSHSNNNLSDFLVLFPQLVKNPIGDINIERLGTRTLTKRTRNSATNAYGEFNDPEHRKLAVEFVKSNSSALENLEGYLNDGKRGVILGYIIPEMGGNQASEASSFKPEECCVGLTIYLPDHAKFDDPVVYEAIGKDSR